MIMPSPGPDTTPVDDEAKAKELARVAVLRVVVKVLGAVLVGLAIVVFSTLILRAVKGGGDKGAAPAAPQTAVIGANPASAPQVQAVLPAGARVASTALGEGRLAVTFESDGEITTILFDAATLAEVGRVRFSRP